MKSIIVNLRGTIAFSRGIIKLCCFLLILCIAVNASSVYFSRSEKYSNAVITLASQKTVIIDAGHGGEDCGAIGVNGAYEKDLNLSMATLLGEEFSKMGYAVIYTRLDDRLLYTDEENIYGIRKISDLKNRCKIGAETPDALFISIHMNSFSDAKYSGAHVYYSEKNNESYQIAMSVQDKIKNDLQPNNNRVPKPGKDIYLLEHLDNPAILIECGFLTNYDECEKLSQKEYQKQLSFSILCGIIEYIDKN